MTAKEIFNGIKAAGTAALPSGYTVDDNLTVTQEVAVTDAVAAYLDTVNPTIKTYPATTP